MKVTLYTAMRNCVSADYPFIQMLRHHLPLVDEVVINEGFSTDGTYEQLQGLDPKVHVFRSKWRRPKGENWWIHFKDEARRAASGDWCIHLDADEFIPEWEFDDIRRHLESTDDLMIPVKFINFYGNYRVYHKEPGKLRKITQKMIIHRNVPSIEFWGDGSNVKLSDEPFRWDVSSRIYTVHHFGEVRHPGALRHGAWSAGRFRTGRSTWWRPPRVLFDMFPHDWMDRDFLDGLAVYDGPYIAPVITSPEDFTKDSMRLYHYLSECRVRSESAPNDSCASNAPCLGAALRR